MSHRKISPGARASLLARFPPDGYVLVTVMDQTIGFIVDGRHDTTVYREATLFSTHENADAGRLRYHAAWKERIAKSIADPKTAPETRSRQIERYSEIDTGDDPWIEAVQVHEHFCDRPDTW